VLRIFGSKKEELTGYWNKLLILLIWRLECKMLPTAAFHHDNHGPRLEIHIIGRCGGISRASRTIIVTEVC